MMNSGANLGVDKDFSTNQKSLEKDWTLDPSSLSLEKLLGIFEKHFWAYLKSAFDVSNTSTWGRVGYRTSGGTGACLYTQVGISLTSEWMCSGLCCETIFCRCNRDISASLDARWECNAYKIIYGSNCRQINDGQINSCRIHPAVMNVSPGKLCVIASHIITLFPYMQCENKAWLWWESLCNCTTSNHS